MIDAVLPLFLWKKFDKSARDKLSAYAISSINALILSIGMFINLIDPRYNQNITADKLYGKSDFSEVLFSYAAGYMVFDTFNMAWGNRFNTNYAAHHVVSYFVLTFIATQPFLQYHTVCFFAFEISTIFLNIRSILQILGLQKAYRTLHMGSQIIFFISFFIIRSGFSLWITIDALVLIYNSHNENILQHPKSALFLVVCNVGMTSLNIMWSSQMIKLAKKAIYMNTDSTEADSKTSKVSEKKKD